VTVDSDELEPKKPQVRRGCLYLLVIGVLLVVGVFAAQVPLRTWRLNRSAGSLQGLAQPGTASVTDPPGIYRHTFSSGEWIAGLSHDSHGFAGGGVLVVRDSRGATRAFTGHVCGDGALQRTCRILELGAQGEAPVDLDAFYADVAENYTERVLAGD
jgi:hypothetical protein